MDGIEGIRILREQFPICMLALSVYDDDERIFAALCAGAIGYLLKTRSRPPSRILYAKYKRASSNVAGGSSPRHYIVQHFTSAKERCLSPDTAGKRAAQELVEGHSYKTAAYHLDISIHTVSFHLRNVYEKLQVHSKSEPSPRPFESRSSKFF